jgi:hypothetical protein
MKGGKGHCQQSCPNPNPKSRLPRCLCCECSRNEIPCGGSLFGQATVAVPRCPISRLEARSLYGLNLVIIKLLTSVAVGHEEKGRSVMDCATPRKFPLTDQPDDLTSHQPILSDRECECNHSGTSSLIQSRVYSNLKWRITECACLDGQAVQADRGAARGHRCVSGLRSASSLVIKRRRSQFAQRQSVSSFDEDVSHEQWKHVRRWRCCSPRRPTSFAKTLGRNAGQECEMRTRAFEPFASASTARIPAAACRMVLAWLCLLPRLIPLTCS